MPGKRYVVIGVLLGCVAGTGLAGDGEPGSPPRIDPLDRDCSEQMVEQRKSALGSDHPDTLEAMTCLARRYAVSGRLDEARALRAEVLESRTRSPGPDHEDTISTLEELSFTYVDNKEYRDAEPLIRKVLEWRQKRLASDHPQTLWSMSLLATVRGLRGHHDEAAELHRKVLEGRRRVLGPEHPGTLTSIDQLGHAYRRLGRNDEAIALFSELLESSRRVFGEDHPSTLKTQSCLAWLLLHRKPAASRDLGRALELAKGVVGKSEQPSSAMLETLARAHLETGDTRSAVEVQKRAIAAVPEDQLDRRGRLVDALRAYEMVLEAEERR